MDKNLEMNVNTDALDLYRKVQNEEAYVIDANAFKFPTAEELAEMNLKDIWNLGYREGMKAQGLHDKLCKEETESKICKNCQGYCLHVTKDEGFCDWLNIKCEPDFYCKDFEAREVK